MPESRTFVATGRMPAAVANVVAQDGMANGIQPGQGTDERRINRIPKLEG